MGRWEHFSRAYTEWADIQRELDAKGEEGWEAVSMVPVGIEVRPVTTRMRFYLVMKRPVTEQVVDALPELRRVTDGDRGNKPV